MYDWFLMDRWDRLLGDLGRALGCDTLFYTASTWGVHQAVPTGEVRVSNLLRQLAAVPRVSTLLLCRTCLPPNAAAIDCCRSPRLPPDPPAALAHLRSFAHQLVDLGMIS